MRFTLSSRWLFLSLALALTGTGCATEDPSNPSGDDFPLSDVDALYEGAPDDRCMSCPVDGKADEVLPSTFDLMEIQTPVRSQGSRGTCTIFATAALMESLYLAEGTIENPDFSEQFLQWSAKIELGSFPNSSGSNPSYNLRAINRFGVVEESVWPYESSEWGTSNDPMCTGDDRPTYCYTNGQPPESALMAQRFHLPAGRWINPSARSLKGHMVSTRTPVVVSGDFFYQSWNHGRSNLKTNSEYSRNGYVLAPNDADIEDSSGDRRAGHGFLLVGWDDELSVPRVDGEGNETGEMETGFFLFKNSWGTGRFGTANPHGAGYGWISYRYVQEHLTAYVSGLPDVMVPEVCNDGVDNDRNGSTDCADAACASERACMDPGDELRNDTAMPIPDNDPSGIGSVIEVAEGGTISSLAVSVDISHSYVGDLTVRLVRGDGVEAILQRRSGGSADDLVRTFDVTEFNGTDAAGTYTLAVSDHAGSDTGTLNGWSMELTRCTTDCGGTPMPREPVEGEAPLSIPDDGSVTSEASVSEGGVITAMSVEVDITHTFPYELTVRFGREGGSEFVLLTESSSSDGVHRTFDVPQFIGEDAAGTWRLTVVDGASGDTGTLDGWRLHVTTR